MGLPLYWDVSVEGGDIGVMVCSGRLEYVEEATADCPKFKEVKDGAGKTIEICPIYSRLH